MLEEIEISYKTMAEATDAEWAAGVRAFGPFAADQPRRVMEHLRLLAGGLHGMPVDRLEHSLQCATRAHRDGRDEEYVVCALLHDIGDLLCTTNHAEMAISILKPFASEANLWMVQHHSIFQGYFYNHRLGLDPNERERFRGHPGFEDTAYFCEFYDQNAFDRDYESMPLEAFEPMLHRVMARPRG